MHDEEDHAWIFSLPFSLDACVLKTAICLDMRLVSLFVVEAVKDSLTQKRLTAWISDDSGDRGMRSVIHGVCMFDLRRGIGYAVASAYHYDCEPALSYADVTASGIPHCRSTRLIHTFATALNRHGYPGRIREFYNSTRRSRERRGRCPCLSTRNDVVRSGERHRPVKSRNVLSRSVSFQARYVVSVKLATPSLAIARRPRFSRRSRLCLSRFSAGTKSCATFLFQCNARRW